MTVSPPLDPPEGTVLRGGIATAAFALLWLAGPALGHDFWIEPSTFRPAEGSLVQVYLRVGEHFVGEPVPRIPRLFERFAVVHRGQEKALTGRDGVDPAGSVAPASTGAHWLVYQSRASNASLKPEAFHAYLLEEGLEAVIERRARRGESDKIGTEAFYRGAKALLCVGETRRKRSTRPVGLPVELVTESDLCAAHSGERLSFRLVFRGEPVAGARVVAVLRDNPEARLSTRSDSTGRARFALADPGVWLIKAVHMIPADAASTVDWESYWASLTFDLDP